MAFLSLKLAQPLFVFAENLVGRREMRSQQKIGGKVSRVKAKFSAPFFRRQHCGWGRGLRVWRRVRVTAVIAFQMCAAKAIFRQKAERYATPNHNLRKNHSSLAHLMHFDCYTPHDNNEKIPLVEECKTTLCNVRVMLERAHGTESN